MTRNIIATKVLKTFPEKTDVHITLFKPRKLRKSNRNLNEADWVCTFEITGLDEDITEESSGVDSMQALLVAIHGIIVTLDKSKKKFAIPFKDKKGRAMLALHDLAQLEFPILVWCGSIEQKEKMLEYKNRITMNMVAKKPKFVKL